MPSLPIMISNDIPGRYFGLFTCLSPCSISKEMKCSVDSEKLHKIVRDNS